MGQSLSRLGLLGQQIPLISNLYGVLLLPIQFCIFPVGDGIFTELS
jgi:hypothetical protein